MWTRAFLILALCASPMLGEALFKLGETCEGEPDEERVCLLVGGNGRHFADIVDEITGKMESAGGENVILKCDQCAVEKGIPGCSTGYDRVILHRWQVTAHKVACILTAIRAQRLEQAAQALALERLNRAADIGRGMPAVRGGEPRVSVRVDYGEAQ